VVRRIAKAVSVRLIFVAVVVAGCSNGATAPTLSKAPPVVAVGNAAACALTADSLAVCWGAAAPGQNSPPYTVSSTLKFAAITAATRFGCALTASGSAYCWGANDRGQLGDGTNAISMSPVAVSGGYSFTSIASGGSHSCALASDGTAYCWGANDFGQLGIADLGGTVVANGTAPVALNNHSFKSISAGGDHTCAVAMDAAVWCWGHNVNGQLGDGTMNDQRTATQISGGVRFESVSAGLGVTCGVTASHAAYCWGGEAADVIGNGQSQQQLTATRVSGSVAFASLAAGGSHVCGLAVDGAAYCWGNNFYGQLGVAGPAQLTPVRAGGALVFRSLSAGPYDYSDETHNVGTSGDSCGVATNGTIYCWGDNNIGQLGQTTPFQSAAPLSVRLPPG
jgi:alpha-tubulin suppressor-like RCC1 family protein